MDIYYGGTMVVISWYPLLIGAAALGINIHAAVALVRGMRARDAPTVSRHARRCGWSVAGFVLLTVGGLVGSLIWSAPRGDDPTERATRLAMTISELMNCIAFIVPVALLPSIAAIVL